MSLHKHARKGHQKFAERHVKRAKGGHIHKDAKQDKALIKKELETAKIKAKRRGGKVRGTEPHHRLDKRARGGRTGSRHGVKVIIHAGGMPGAGQPNPQAEQAAHQAGIQQGMRAGAALGAKAAASRMAGPPGGGMTPPGAGGPAMPPQAMPGGRPPMANGPMPPGIKRGGQVPRNRGGKIHDTAHAEQFGAGSGMGRYGKEGVPIPKAEGGTVHVKAHTRARGGSLEC